VDLRPGNASPKAFSHNGYFKSLKGIVHFYNTRDVKGVCPDDPLFTTEKEALKQDCWPKPEEVKNVNRAELGDLDLSSDEEDAIVAFMKTLSDGYVPIIGQLLGLDLNPDVTPEILVDVKATAPVGSITMNQATGEATGTSTESVNNNVGLGSGAIPEPATIALIGIGLFGMLVLMRRRWKQ
jgi:hypothetical protein